ncbi:hypothetical protein COT78_04255 [Candidatus Berkelbacteria bacterium CG10_big_fil_rev_8_21_14_0_10_43_13]|uniref:Uncharacterized protein n=1 Tax=Candidatus Berkelbacteria bacterium CG10_big_fil_rev_8_21_14_0_10_43_13 TaxID=1974514 RepID=A0A2H0W5J0_9BACT|nr:MAG: hypothetical protein COT78_04255 [Candidatus Berkelbacteria bacterium CG10_big_fil_rev_8_21_14_0_10_43_13]
MTDSRACSVYLQLQEIDGGMVEDGDELKVGRYYKLVVEDLSSGADRLDPECGITVTTTLNGNELRTFFDPQTTIARIAEEGVYVVSLKIPGRNEPVVLTLIAGPPPVFESQIEVYMEAGGIHKVKATPRNPVRVLMSVQVRVFGIVQGEARRELNADRIAVFGPDGKEHSLNKTFARFNPVEPGLHRIVCHVHGDNDGLLVETELEVVQ